MVRYFALARPLCLYPLMCESTWPVMWLGSYENPAKISGDMSLGSALIYQDSVYSPRWGRPTIMIFVGVKKYGY